MSSLGIEICIWNKGEMGETPEAHRLVTLQKP